MRAFTGLTVKPGARLGRSLARGVNSRAIDLVSEQRRRRVSAVVEDVQEQASEDATGAIDRPDTREERALQAAIEEAAAIDRTRSERALRVSQPATPRVSEPTPLVARVTAARERATQPRPARVSEPSEVIRRTIDAANLRRGL